MNQHDINELSEVIKNHIFNREDVIYSAQKNTRISQSSLNHISNYLTYRITDIDSDVKLLRNGLAFTLNGNLIRNNIISEYLMSLILMRRTTIVFNHLEKRIPGLNILFNNLIKEYGVLTHFNLYWSPFDSQGAGEHKDPHDVLIIQLSGSKKWRVQNESYILEVGDMLFLKKGILHDPSTNSTQHSIHLTVGISDLSHLKNKVECLNIKPCLDLACRTKIFIESMRVFFSGQDFHLVFTDEVQVKKSGSNISIDHLDSSIKFKEETFNFTFLKYNNNKKLIFRNHIDIETKKNIILSFYERKFPLRIQSFQKTLPHLKNQAPQ